jgi:hypothetical protein
LTYSVILILILLVMSFSAEWRQEFWGHDVCLFFELNFLSPKFGIRSNNQKIINASPKFGFASLREPQRPA